jgi:hypothetical protein
MRGDNKDSQPHEVFDVSHNFKIEHRNAENNDFESPQSPQYEKIGKEFLNNPIDDRKPVFRRTATVLWFVSMYIMGLAMRSILRPDSCHLMDAADELC